MITDYDIMADSAGIYDDDYHNYLANEAGFHNEEGDRLINWDDDEDYPYGDAE